MASIVDARGLACPQPVILTRRALKEGIVVTTIVDNESAQHNVTRMAEKSGATVQVEQREDGTYLFIAKEGTPVEKANSQPASTPSNGPLVVSVPSEFMGRGDAELGHILIRGFFHTLGEVEPLPDTIVFFNSGVKLVAEGSPVLEDLQELGRRGVEILACGTCVMHYELMGKVDVAEISNMYTIAETILGAGKVVGL